MAGEFATTAWVAATAAAASTAAGPATGSGTVPAAPLLCRARASYLTASCGLWKVWERVRCNAPDAPPTPVRWQGHALRGCTMEETPVQPHTRKDTGCNLVPDQKTSMSGEYFPLARRSLVILRRRHCSPMACSHCGFRGPPGLRRSPRLAAARHCFSASARNSRNGLGPLWRAFFAAGSRPIATMARLRDTAKWWAGKFPVTCMCRIWASRRKHRAAIAAKSGGRPPRSARRWRACRHLSARGAANPRAKEKQ